MNFYNDLHNLYHGKTTPIIGAVEDFEEPKKFIEQLAQPQLKIDARLEEIEYREEMEAKYREKQLEKTINNLALGAGLIWFFEIL